MKQTPKNLSWIAVAMFWATSPLSASPWNLPPETLKTWLSHATFFVQRTMNEDGSTGGEVEQDKNFLQSSGMSLTYSPNRRLHVGLLGLFEPSKDNLGRPTPSSWGESFGNYGFRWLEADLHYGLSDDELSPSIGAFYNLPTDRPLSEAPHTFGLKAANALPSFHPTWTLTLTLKGALSRSFSGEGTWNATALALAEAYWDLATRAQPHLSLEGLFSSWHYLKASLGLNIPFKGDAFKVGLRYGKTFFGKWVLPSDSVEVSVEARQRFGR